MQVDSGAKIAADINYSKQVTSQLQGLHLLFDGTDIQYVEAALTTSAETDLMLEKQDKTFVSYCVLMQ